MFDRFHYVHFWNILSKIKQYIPDDIYGKWHKNESQEVKIGLVHF